MGVLGRAVAAAVTTALAASVVGCSEETERPAPQPTASASPPAAYDGASEPSAAVLALVPEQATTVLVTDFDEVRAQLGMDSVSSASPAAERAAFWQAADSGAPLLIRGRLRPADERLVREFGFGADDVAWEATFSGGGAAGWAIRLRDGVDMAAVQRAVEAGVAPLAGGTVRPEDHLVVSGAPAADQPNWAGLAELETLVGSEASATYVERGCLAGDPGTARLQPLAAYSVAFGSTLATARLGEGRTDLFDRLALVDQLPSFAQGLSDGVADPSSGRLGFQIVDPVKAADLALRQQLSFAVCAP